MSRSGYRASSVPSVSYLTGQLQPDGCFVGTFTALHARSDSTFFGEVALLSQMTQARAREEIYRREAETMLEGLRILLGQEPALEKLEALASLMARAINGAPHLLLRVSRNGRAATHSWRCRCAGRRQCTGRSLPESGIPP